VLDKPHYTITFAHHFRGGLELYRVICSNDRLTSFFVLVLSDIIANSRVFHTC
jgi:hypothetical protein